MVPTKYRVKAGRLADHVDAKPGDYVYSLMGTDYGLASDDTRATGVPHVSVTLDKFGRGSSFTMPVTALETVPKDEAVYPDGDHLKNVCRLGQGVAQCLYLTQPTGGFSCEKHSWRRSEQEYKSRQVVIQAEGDNCEGLYSR